MRLLQQISTDQTFVICSQIKSYSIFSISSSSWFPAVGDSLHLSSHVPSEASISETFFLRWRGFSLQYFIATWCLTLTLYFIIFKSHNNLLTLLNSFNHLGTRSFINVTKFLSSARLALNFQKEGPWADLSILLIEKKLLRDNVRLLDLVLENVDD